MCFLFDFQDLKRKKERHDAKTDPVDTIQDTSSHGVISSATSDLVKSETKRNILLGLNI